MPLVDPPSEDHDPALVNSGRPWLAVVVLAVGALAACSSFGGSSKVAEVDPNLFPTDYKQEILNTMTQTLQDPTNVRDAYLSDPVLAPVGKDQRYTACVRYNARNAAKHYMGSQDRIAYFSS